MKLAVLWTDGQLNLKDIKNECKKEKWFPVLVYRLNNEIIVPLFDNDKTVLAFIKKNLPENWSRGRIELIDEDVEWVLNQGWKIREMDYPNKLRDLPNIQMGFEVVQLSNEPELQASRG